MSMKRISPEPSNKSEDLRTAMKIDDSETSTSTRNKLFDAVVTGLFGIMHILNNNSSPASQAYVFAIVSDAFQLLYFAFDVEVFTYNPIFFNPMNSIVSFWLLDFFKDPGTSIFWFAVSVCLGIILTQISLAAIIGHSFSQQHLKLVYMFGFFRTSSRLLMGVLFMPFISLLLSVFTCGDDGMHTVATSTVCWEGTHAAFASVTFVLLLAFTIFTSMSALMFFDRNPKSTSISASSTGRVNWFVIVNKLAINAAFATSNEAQFLAVVLMASSCSLIAAFLYFIPLYSLFANQLNVVSYSVFAWASLCATSTVILNDPTDNGPLLLFLVPLPMVIYTAITVTSWRYNSVANMDVKDMTKDFLLPICLNVKVNRKDIKTIEIEDQFDEAVEFFPDSVALKLYISAYWDSAKFPEPALLIMRDCDTLKPDFDQSFAIFRRYRQEDESAKSGSVALDAMSLIKLEHHELEMEHHILLCHSTIISFWQEIRREHSDHSTCMKLSSDIHKYSTHAREHFQATILIQPSAQNIRRFATFTIHTLNNKWKADDLLASADRVEEEQLKRKRQLLELLKNVDIRKGIDLNMSEIAAAGDVCVMTLGCDDDNLGIIIECGRLVTEILGYEPEDLIGKNINVIVPEPIASMHDTLLRRFVTAGKGSFIGKTRLVPAVAASGYLQNIYLTLFDRRSAGEKKFVGMIRIVANTTSFAVVNSDDMVTSLTERFPGFTDNMKGGDGAFDAIGTKTGIGSPGRPVGSPGGRPVGVPLLSGRPIGVPLLGTKLTFNISTILGEGWRTMAKDSSVVINNVEYTVSMAKIHTMHMDSDKPVSWVHLSEVVEEGFDYPAQNWKGEGDGNSSSRFLKGNLSVERRSLRGRSGSIMPITPITPTAAGSAADFGEDGDDFSVASDIFSDELRLMHENNANSKESHAALGPLTMTVRILFVLSVLVSIVTVIIPRYETLLIKSKIDDLLLSSQRQYYLNEVLLLSRDMSVSLTNTTELQHLISLANSELSTIHHHLHFSDFPDYEPLASLESVPSIPIVDSGVTTLMTLWSSVKEFISKSSIVANARNTNDLNIPGTAQSIAQSITQRNLVSGLEYIHVNGKESIASACRNATLLRLDWSSDAAFVGLGTNLGAIIAVAILGLLVIALLRRTYDIRKQNVSVFNMLRNIPSQLLNRIGAHYEENLTTMLDFSSSTSAHLHWKKRRKMKKKRKVIAVLKDNEKNFLCMQFIQRVYRGINSGNIFSILLFASQFSLFLIIVACLQVVVVTSFNGLADVQKTGSSRVVYSSQITIELQFLTYYVREFAVFGAYREVSLSLVKDQISQILNLQNAILFGADEYNTVHLSENSLSDVMYGNACSYLQPEDQQSSCASFGEGVLRNGMYTGILDIVDLALFVVTSPDDAIVKSSYEYFEEFSLKYLIPISVEFSQMVYDDTYSSIAYVGDFLVWSGAICCGVLLLAHSLVYLPGLKKVEKIMRHNAALPLLIPIDVAENCEAVMRFVKTGRFDGEDDDE